MAFSSALSFLLSTHSVYYAVPLLLSIHVLIVPFFFFSSVHRANCALFLQFTALIVPFWRSVHRTFFRYIVISSNSTLPIMKRNWNGISLFLKRKIAFFETENHWPYIVAGGSCLHSMNMHHYKAAFVNGIRSTRVVLSKVNLHYTFCRRASSISCWYATSWHLFTYTWHKNAVRASRITSTASPTGMINLIFFNLSSSVAFCHRDTSTSSPDSCFPCRASFNFVPSLQVAHWLSMHPSSNRQSAFSTLHCRLHVGSRALVRLMKFAVEHWSDWWSSHVSDTNTCHAPYFDWEAHWLDVCCRTCWNQHFCHVLPKTWHRLLSICTTNATFASFPWSPQFWWLPCLSYPVPLGYHVCCRMLQSPQRSLVWV